MKSSLSGIPILYAEVGRRKREKSARRRHDSRLLSRSRSGSHSTIQDVLPIQKSQEDKDSDRKLKGIKRRRGGNTNFPPSSNSSGHRDGKEELNQVGNCLAGGESRCGVPVTAVGGLKVQGFLRYKLGQLAEKVKKL